MLAQQQRNRRTTQRRLAAGRQTAPGHPAAEAQTVELFGRVVGHPRRQNVAFPGGRGSLEAFQLLDHRSQSFGAAHLILARHVLPMQQEAQEVGGADRLDLCSQAAQRIAMDAREQAAVAPLELGGARREAAAQDPSLCLEAEQDRVDFLTAEFPRSDGTQHFHPARDELERRIGAALQRKPRVTAFDSALTESLDQ